MLARVDVVCPTLNNIKPIVYRTKGLVPVNYS